MTNVAAAPAAVGIALIAISIIAMAILHVTARRISALDRTMSEYATVGWPQRIVFGICVLSIAVAAAILIALNLDHIVAVVGLSVSALGMATAGFALADDLDPAGPLKTTVHGTVHNVGALFAFVGPIVAALALIPTFQNVAVGIVVGVIPLVGTLIFFATLAVRERRLRSGRRSIHGIGERIALVAMWLWFVLALLASS